MSPHDDISRFLSLSKSGIKMLLRGCFHDKYSAAMPSFHMLLMRALAIAYDTPLI